MSRRLLIATLAAAFFVPPRLAAAQADDRIVKLGYNLFEPGELRIARGTRVTFQNEDSVPHHVGSGSAGLAFNLGVIRPNDGRSYVFNRAGTVAVVCALHPRMQMTVVVE